MGDTVWSIAVEEVRELEEKKRSEKVVAEERTVLICGVKNSGKTSSLLRFLERNDERAKPSVALEYTFARRQKASSSEKDIVHLWELAGGTFLSNLMDAVLVTESILQLSIVLVVDLSQPDILWVTAEKLLMDARARIGKLSASSASVRSGLEKDIHMRESLFQSRQSDSEIFPVPLLIIGTKFDLFQSLDSAEKRMITKTLRFISHSMGADLIYISEKVPATIRVLKVFMNRLSFNVALQKIYSTDDSKPIAITAGSDTFEAIGGPLSADGNWMKGSNHTWQEWKQSYCSLFPQKDLDASKTDEDPAQDPQFAETVIDNLKKQKFLEIEKFRKAANRKEKDIIFTE